MSDTLQDTAGMSLFTAFLIFAFAANVQCQEKAFEGEQLSSVDGGIKPRTGAGRYACGRPLATVPDAGTGEVQNAQDSEWPWQAMIWRYFGSDSLYRLTCSGTLIDKQWVISAASCFDVNVTSHTAILLGARFSNLTDKNRVAVAPGAILCHGQFNSKTLENDICLVKLGFEINYANHILPVCLPSLADNFQIGDKCVVTGWSVAQGTADKNTLQEALVNKTSKLNCPSKSICVGDGDGPCYRFIGGPLACNKTEDGSWHYTLFGVSSSSGNCTSNTKQAVYTDVTKYLDWIETTKSNSPDVRMCFDKLTIRTCGSIIVTNNTVVRSPVSNNQIWDYPSNTNCSWTFRAPLQYVLKFRFICFMSIETTTSNVTSCNDDYLQITELAGRGKRYCGSHYVDRLEPFSTIGNEATMTFHSNKALNARGFVVQVEFEKKYGEMCFNRSTIRTCGSTIVTNNTIVRSPVNDYQLWHYPSNMECSWTFRAPIGHALIFKFLCFVDIDGTTSTADRCNDDYLQIAEPDGKSHTYCGSRHGDELEPFSTVGNEATMRFHSNKGLNSLGFVVRVEFEKKYSEQCFDRKFIHSCGSSITANNTIIRSPTASSSNWMYSSNSIDCSWTVRAPRGHTLKFEYLCFFETAVGAFDTECDSSDYLLLQPKNERGLRRCGHFNVSELESFQTKGNEATLTFYSRLGAEDNGFVIRVVFSASEAVHSCCIALLLLPFLVCFSLD